MVNKNAILTITLWFCGFVQAQVPLSRPAPIMPVNVEDYRAQQEQYFEWGGGFVPKYNSEHSRGLGAHLGFEWSIDDPYPKGIIDIESDLIWGALQEGILGESYNHLDTILDADKYDVRGVNKDPSDKTFFKVLLRSDFISHSKELIPTIWQHIVEGSFRGSSEQDLSEIDHEFLIGVSRSLKTSERYIGDFSKPLRVGKRTKKKRVDLNAGIFVKLKSNFIDEMIRTIYPTLRIELSYVASEISAFKAKRKTTGKVYAFAEINLLPRMLKRTLNGLVVLVIPEEECLVDISSLTGFLSDQWIHDNVALLLENHSQKILQLDSEQASQVLHDLAERKIGSDKFEFAQDMGQMLSSYAPMTATAIHGGQFLVWLRSVLRSTKVKSIGRAAGKVFVVGDLILATGEMVTDPYMIELALKGSVSARTKIYSALEFHDAVLNSQDFQQWVRQDPNITYPLLLEILQRACNDPILMEEGRLEAREMIENANILKYMDELESFAKQRGFHRGAMFANAGDMVEALYLHASSNSDRRNLLLSLKSRFGLFRDSHDLESPGQWWLTASEVVSEGDEAVINSQKKILDALANIFRSDGEYSSVLNARKQKAIANMAVDLGVYLTPEIIERALHVQP